MFRSVVALILIGMACAFVGCGGDGSSGSAFEQVQNEYREQDEIICACAAELGYGSEAECQMGYSITSSEWQCIYEGLESAGMNADAVFSCLLPLDRDYTSCIERLSCDDFANYVDEDECDSPYIADVDDCFSDPAAAENVFADCI